MSEDLWYCMLLHAKTTWLNDKKIALPLDENHVNWENLNTDFLMSIVVNCAIKKIDTDKCSKKLVTTDLSLLDPFQQAYYLRSVNSNRKQTI